MVFVTSNVKPPKKPKPAISIAVTTPKPEPPKKKQEVPLPELEEAEAPSRQGTRQDALELAQARARNAGIPETSSEFPILDPEKRGGVITTRADLAAEAAAAEEASKGAAKEELTEEQAEIRAREEGLRGEGLPPEEQVEGGMVGDESTSILQKASEIYKWIDTMGGLMPEETYNILQENTQAGMLPVTPAGGIIGGMGAIKSGKAALSTSKVATGIRASKSWIKMTDSLKAALKTKKLWSYAGLGYVYLTEKRMSNIDSALSQVRETLTLPVALASATGDYRTSHDQLNDLGDDINEYESRLKAIEPYSLSTKLTGRTWGIYQRLDKLRLALDVSREQLYKAEAINRPMTDEETTIALQEINTILDSMAEAETFWSSII